MKKLLFYISFCFCFWVRSRFCFVFLVMGFVFPFRRFVFLFRVLGFRFCLLFRVLDFYFRVLNVCFVLRASRETFSFLLFMILVCIVIMVFILCFRFEICVSVLGFVFHFWVCGVHFPYRPRYIFDRRISVNLFTGGNLTRLSISWQFRQEKGSIISEFKQVSHMSMLYFFFFRLFSRST